MDGIDYRISCMLSCRVAEHHLSCNEKNRKVSTLNESLECIRSSNAKVTSAGRNDQYSGKPLIDLIGQQKVLDSNSRMEESKAEI